MPREEVARPAAGGDTRRATDSSACGYSISSARYDSRRPMLSRIVSRRSKVASAGRKLGGRAQQRAAGADRCVPGPMPTCAGSARCRAGRRCAGARQFRPRSPARRGSRDCPDRPRGRRGHAFEGIAVTRRAALPANIVSNCRATLRGAGRARSSNRAKSAQPIASATSAWSSGDSGRVCVCWSSRYCSRCSRSRRKRYAARELRQQPSGSSRRSASTARNTASVGRTRSAASRPPRISWNTWPMNSISRMPPGTELDVVGDVAALHFLADLRGAARAWTAIALKSRWRR